LRISIFGMGYVGAVSAACLARDGHQVIGVDLDPLKLDLLRQGRSPIVEEGIQELTRKVVSEGRITVTDDTEAAIRDTELSFVCVGTPSSPNGRQDLGAVLRLASQLGAALAKKRDFHVVVIRSTVEPGTVEDEIRPRIEADSGKKAGVDFGLCFQPEFLREGTSIKDYDNPPFTVVGASDERSAARLRELFGHLPCEFVVTDVRNAEMMKYACNAFHALKVTFANEIGRLAQSLDVDSHAVMGLVCKDTRLNISPAYLRPGFAFGGSCLPKDLKALLYLGKQRDVVTPMLASLLASNRVHIDHAIDRVLADGRRKVGMLGLSFKTGTDDLRESPLVTLAERFIGKGLSLRIHDPEVSLSRLMGANKRYIETSIPHIAQLMCGSLREMLEPSDVVIVGLHHRGLMDQVCELARPDQLVLDLVNMPGRERIRAAYQGICW
jgi:GDP-mannose 6-dehydrogenase